MDIRKIQIWDTPPCKALITNKDLGCALVSGAASEQRRTQIIVLNQKLGVPRLQKLVLMKTIRYTKGVPRNLSSFSVSHRAPLMVAQEGSYRSM